MIKFLTNKNFSIEIENEHTLAMAITTSKYIKKNERTNKKK